MNVVYTAIFGQYDKPYKPTAISETTSYFCLSDTATWTVSDPYKLIPRPKHGDNRRSSRFYKINSHLTFPMADITIWHGGNVQLKCKPEHLVELLGDADMATLAHDQRHCLYDEAKVCKLWGLDDTAIIDAQINRYQHEGMPFNYGLYATFLLVRRNTPYVREFNRLWWQEVANGSVRDQISFPYICWKLDFRPGVIEGDIYKGPCHERHAIHRGKS